MKDLGLETAIRLTGQNDLVRLIEDVEAGKAGQVLISGAVGFADERALHDRIVRYLWSLGAEVQLVPSERPMLHPLPDRQDPDKR